MFLKMLSGSDTNIYTIEYGNVSTQKSLFRKECLDNGLFF